jgi:tetratricopeptide (TPR) repeat protein
MTNPDDISVDLRDEYNDKFEKAFDRLSKYALIHDSCKSAPGSSAKKHLKEAVLLLGRCVEIWRESWNAMWGLGKAHQALGNHRTALGWFERALKIEKNNPDVFREATIESLGLGSAETALAYARAACDLVPDNAGLQANLALALLLNKRGEEALSTIRKACEMCPDDPVNKSVLAFVTDVIAGKRPYPTKI